MTDKTYIVNDQPIPKERRDFADTDALDFTPRAAVKTLADIAATGDTLLTIGVFGLKN
jgi:hypothetical protein